MNRPEDAAEAARMVAFAMARRKAPARSGEYARLVQRFDTEPDFAQMVRMVAKGFDLTVLEVHPLTGLVLGITPETDFAVSVSDLVPQTTDRPLYLLAQLTIAAMVFPRPEDLDDDEHVGRISVRQVDDEVRVLASGIERRLAQTGEDVDPPSGQLGLEGLWRAYLRRNATGKTKTQTDRAPQASTRALVKRAFTHLESHGFVRKVSDEDAGKYVTHVKYRLQIRDQAARDMLQELAELGVAALPTGGEPNHAQHSPDAQPSPDEAAPVNDLFS
ncbi:hypothetical protein ACFRQM_18745 [Streptomyces sp. NPDC056831]|uniref:hypothetical protein n=1 Tax=Streptomyces sp. NPDC056831 TaxID=3345954 RepID=UPI0036A3DFF8